MFYALIRDDFSNEIMGFYSKGGLDNFLRDFDEIPDVPGFVYRVDYKLARTVMERTLREIAASDPLGCGFHVSEIPRMGASELYETYREALSSHPYIPY